MGSNPAGRTTPFPLESIAMWMKIFLLLSLWWIWRIMSRLIRRPRRRSDVGRAPHSDAEGRRPEDRDLGNLTRQDISDADYEEIQ